MGKERMRTAIVAPGRRIRQAGDLDQHEEKAGGWYVSICGLIFLGILNWRLDVWLAPLYGVGTDAMDRLLPMAFIHWLSAIAIAWTGALVFITQEDRKS